MKILPTSIKSKTAFNLYKIFIILSSIFIIGSGCNKLIDIQPPVSSITNEQVFSDSANAASAVLGLYGVLNNRESGIFGGGYMSAYLGLYADELTTNFIDNIAYSWYTGVIDTRDGFLAGNFWAQPYYTIYQCNVIIDQIEKSKSIDIENKKIFTGEAKFVRAFSYFYLINLFGDVPLITSWNYKETSNVPKTSQTSIYSQIVKDLEDAKTSLPDSYKHAQGERIRANRYTAIALLARVHLYQKNWESAVNESTEVINNPQYSLESSPETVFGKNNNEAIFQFHIDSRQGYYSATGEGAKFVPLPGEPPAFSFRKEFLDSFEPDDKRKINWIDSTEFNGEFFVYPKKYKIGLTMSDPNSDPPQYYTVLRLAEQILIRSEANAQLGKIQESVNDINRIRNRAGINEISSSIEKSALIEAIIKERKFELMAEFGHRWFDIKRMQLSDGINKAIKPQWETYRNIFPIPATQLEANPSLVQNSGY